MVYTNHVSISELNFSGILEVIVGLHSVSLIIIILSRIFFLFFPEGTVIITELYFQAVTRYDLSCHVLST